MTAHHESDNERIVFIRGTGRCSSKTLVNQLGLHPALSQVPVNEVLPEDLLDWTEYQVSGYWQNIPAEAAESACRAYFSAFCRTMTSSQGIIVQKSTMRAHRLSTLLKCWPHAKMIYLVRHPIPTVESLINSNIYLYPNGQGFQSTVANSLLRWYNDILAYIRSEAFGNPRVLQVHFEGLIGDPNKTLERIYRFIGVDPILYNPDVSQSESHRYTRRFVLNESERRWIIESTREVVQQLGYHPDDWPPEVPSKYSQMLTDYPDRRLRAIPPALDGVELIQATLTEAANQGYCKIGLIGAGYLTRLICPYLQDMPVEIKYIFDENPALVGKQLAGFSIERPEKAIELGIQAIIPVTLVHQQLMMQRWQRLFGDKITFLPLWNEHEDTRQECDSMIGANETGI